MLNLRHIRKQIRSGLKVLKCGAGEGWRRSIGPIFIERKYYGVKAKKVHSKLNKMRKD